MIFLSTIRTGTMMKCTFLPLQQDYSMCGLIYCRHLENSSQHHCSMFPYNLPRSSRPALNEGSQRRSLSMFHLPRMFHHRSMELMCMCGSGIHNAVSMNLCCSSFLCKKHCHSRLGLHSGNLQDNLSMFHLNHKQHHRKNNILNLYYIYQLLLQEQKCSFFQNILCVLGQSMFLRRNTAFRSHSNLKNSQNITALKSSMSRPD